MTDQNAGVEQIGIEAFLRTASFLAGVKVYNRGIDEMNTKTSGFVSKISNIVTRTLGKLAERLHSLGRDSDAAGSGLGNLNAISLTLANTLGNILYGALNKVVGTVKSFVSQGIMAAARAQEMGYVLEILGARAGKTVDDMNRLVASIREYGIRTDVAQNLVAQFTREQLDLSKAQDLARAAQDTAILSMLDSSDQLQRMLYGISKFDIEILRTAGVVIPSSQAAFDKYAATLGKTADQLTIVEKRNAFMNAVLEETAKNAGLYEKAMEAPGKQLRSFSRDVYELMRVIGTPFLGAFGSFVGVLRGTAKTFRIAFDEGGRLHGILERLGIVADIAGEGLASMAEKGTNAVIDFIAGSESKLYTFAENALKWGVNISSNLAAGIVEGAVNFLVAAMNFIGGILANWLSPGSPPKVAQDLPKWGAAAMGQWLKGFTEADFGILKGVQGPLKSAMDLMLSLGKIDEKEYGQRYANISKQIAKALSGGTVGAGLFDKIAKAAGIYGDEIAELAKRQFGLAKSQENVEAAEKRLAALREKETNVGKKISNITKEYNELLRSGASKDVLKAKLKQINAAEKEEKATIKARQEAEGQVDVAKEQVEVFKQLVSSQEELVNQLLEISKMQIIPQLDEESLKGGAIPDIGEQLGEQLGTAIGGGLSGALDEQKEKLKAKFLELFQPFRDAYDEKIAPKIEEFKGTWQKFVNILKQVWDEKVKPIINDIKEFIPDTTLERFGSFIGFALAAGAVFTVLSTVLGLVLSPLGLLVGSLFLLAVMWEKYGKQAMTTLNQLTFIAYHYLTLASTAATQLVTILFILAGNAVLAVINKFREWIFILVTAYLEVKNLKEKVIDLKDNAIQLLHDKVEEVKNKIDEWKNKLIDIKDNALELLHEAVNKFITEPLTDLYNKLESFIDNILTPLRTGLKFAYDKFVLLESIIRTILDLIKNADFSALDFLLGHSPSPLAIGVKYARDELRKFATMELPLLNSKMSLVPTRPVGNTYYSSNDNRRYADMRGMIGNANVGKSSDLFMIKNIIRKEVRSVLGV